MKPRKGPRRIYAIDCADFWDFGETLAAAIDSWETHNHPRWAPGSPPKPIAYLRADDIEAMRRLVQAADAKKRKVRR